MKISKFLNFDINSINIITICGAAASGKTTIMSLITNEFLRDGKNVLYITDEKIGTIARKVNTNGLDIANGNHKLVVKKTLDFDGIESYIEKQLLDGNKYDLVLIDVPNYKFDYSKLKELSMENNFGIIFSKQIITDLFNPSSIPIGRNQLAHLSDVVISITKTIPEEKTFWQKVKNFFIFWNKKPNPNIHLKMLKNRYGKQNDYKFNMDFEKLIIK